MTTSGSIEAQSNSLDQWEEEDYIKALAHLEEMNSELEVARLIPRRLLQSLNINNRTSKPQILQFQKTAIQASRSLGKLTDIWNSEQSDRIKSHCLQSPKDLDLSLGAGIPLFGWVDKAKELEAIKTGNGSSNVQQVDSVVEELKNGFQKLEWKDESHKQLQAVVTGNGPKLTFLVQEKKLGAIPTYLVNCVEYKLITEILAKRDKQEDLKYLLEMISEYKSLYSEACEVCKQHLDKNAQLPVIRKERLERSQDASRWIALHEGC